MVSVLAPTAPFQVDLSQSFNGTHGDGPQKRFTALWDKDMSDWDAIKSSHTTWKTGK